MFGKLLKALLKLFVREAVDEAAQLAKDEITKKHPPRRPPQ